MSFPSNCGSRYVAVDASCGCALTRASIVGMTPDTFEAQGATEVYMDRVISSAAEAVVAGYQEKFLESLLNSRMVPIKGELARAPIKNESIILPYIYRRQKRNINSNYWLVTAGEDNDGEGLHSGAWDVTVSNNPSKYGTPLTNIERFFLPGRYVLIETVDASTKAAYAMQFKIIASVNDGSDATLTLEPNYSDAGWSGLTSDQKKAWQPTAGLLLNLANSVSDYESWCYNDPSDNPNMLLCYWLQTSRETSCVNTEYLMALNAALTSGYWKQFKQLPLAQQKVQQQAQAYKAWLNSVFFGQRINENQDVNNYTNLPTVVDPNATDCTLEYKANALGFEQQLIDCGRYGDLAGNPLDLADLFDLSYDMKRAREASGGTIDRIEWATNRTNAGRIFTTMLNFFKAYYGVDNTRFYKPNEKLTFEKQVMLNYDLYEIPAEFGGFELVIWHDDYFSDKLLAAGTDADQINRQRTMWALDWSDIQLGIADSNSVQRVSPDPATDRLYNCVIKAVQNTYILKSKKWTSIIEDPLRHYVLKNFSGDCPVLATDNVCSGTSEG